MKRGTSSDAYLTLNDILARLRHHYSDLAARYHLRSLGVFGSFVRGDQRKRSDIDLLVEFDEVPSLFRFIQLEMELGGLLCLKVDLVMRSALKPAIGRHIQREVVPV